MDDRLEFERTKKDQCIALGQDSETFENSLSLIAKLDKFDYPYLWNWLGLPIIQMPADIMATQEIIWTVKPDIIIETGVARGGSVIFMASILELLGKGTVIGVDIDIREHNRRAIEEHPMSKRVKLVEGSSVATETLDKVRGLIPNGASVMVILDSDHSRDHVLKECHAYGPLVTTGSYLVVADTVVGFLSGNRELKKRSRFWKQGDEPLAGLKQFLTETDRFEVDPVINGKLVVSSSPGGYLKCIS